MFLTCHQVQAWFEKNHTHLGALGGQLIICPSYESLSFVATWAKKKNFSLGTQDCSAHQPGAHTGQVSAQSLAEIGCTYCIVAHSEQRKNLTNSDISQKLTNLAANTITPIFCIEDSSPEQLEPAQQFIAEFPGHKLLVAYEPPSAIGSGAAASLASIISAQKLTAKYLKSPSVHFIYGGSVSPENSGALKALPAIDGFLIGKASTDAAKLHAIISSTAAI